jgi:hypothetical protein
VFVLIDPGVEVVRGVDAFCKVGSMVFNKGKAAGECLVCYIFAWTPFTETNALVPRADPYQ